MKELDFAGFLWDISWQIDGTAIANFLVLLGDATDEFGISSAATLEPLEKPWLTAQYSEFYDDI